MLACNKQRGTTWIYRVEWKGEVKRKKKVRRAEERGIGKFERLKRKREKGREMAKAVREESDDCIESKLYNGW